MERSCTTSLKVAGSISDRVIGIFHSFVVTMGVASSPMSLVCSASWGEGTDYNLVPTPKRHYLLK